jgi:indolepyruvate ferredoxin oxidoreductase
MVIDTTAASPPASQTLTEIAEHARPEHGRFVDAQQATSALFGDDQQANAFLLGVSYRLGYLPIEADFIERAIGLNGAALEVNRQAFRRGQQLIRAPEEFQARLRTAEGRATTDDA